MVEDGDEKADQVLPFLHPFSPLSLKKARREQGGGRRGSGIRREKGGERHTGGRSSGHGMQQEGEAGREAGRHTSKVQGTSARG